MVKSVLGVNHRGFSDWVMQRITAIYTGIYSIGLILYCLFHPHFSYGEWHGLFAATPMKVASILFLMGLVFHAWIGMWTVMTDYIKPFVLSCIMHLFVFLFLAACLIWGILILWSV
jgi:succinate dehydrogenase / fumarate reductase, membrane anchor subunit